MRSVKSSAREWQAAAARLGVLIIIVQALGLRAGWSQDATRPRLDEEISKQEEIYHSGLLLGEICQ